VNSDRGLSGASPEPGLNRWVRPAVRELRPYHIEDAAGLIKLDAMENPHPWPAELRGAFVEALRSVELNRYPDGEARALKQRLRGYLGLSDDTGLLLGNGSDELIQMIGLTVGGPGRYLLCPEPSFSMYRILAAVTGMRYVGVPLRGQDFDLDHEAMQRTIDRHQPAVVVLSYPNNPTGNLFERRSIEAVIEASPGLVLIDEAYFDFSGETLLDRVTGRPPVLVLRTLSKIGLAGLRVGFLIGDPQWLAEINKVRLPYNIGALSQASADWVLSHAEVLREQALRIRRDRDALCSALRRFEVLEVSVSHTNFLLVRAPGLGESLFAGLKAEGILVKSLHGAHPLLADCIRITVGSAEENQALLAALARRL
jgi:histidinol-phosphate aminotransferase